MYCYTIDQAKESAKKQKKHMDELGIKVKYAECLELVARQHDYKNWGAYEAALKRGALVINFCEDAKWHEKVDEMFCIAKEGDLDVDHDIIFQLLKPRAEGHWVWEADKLMLKLGQIQNCKEDDTKVKDELIEVLRKSRFLERLKELNV